MTIETMLASALGGLLVIAIGLLLRNSYRTADKLDEIKSSQSATTASLASISSTLAGVVLRVDALDRWKDDEQKRQLAALQKALDDYREEHP